MNDGEAVVYWDTSALISAMIMDRHSETAGRWAGKKGLHLISTLAYAEFCAVISRMTREGLLSSHAVKSVFDSLDNGPWRFIATVPTNQTIRRLSEKWPLRGADLWHLAAAKTLCREFPELMLLSFDQQLQRSAKDEGL